jgi:glycosyltransferase involved in cell wall biosynthesis
MLSFIIIGRNEGWKLSKCFDSVIKAISENLLKKYEIIYIDSKSSDASVKRAKQYSNIKIIQLTGDINAAIARNIGAKESVGEVMVFLDGDMEIISENLSFFYTEEFGLVYPFLSGDWYNSYYSHDWKYLRKDNGLGLKNDVKRSTVGGLFFIERYLWDSVGGMRIGFKRSQDIDLALRLAKQRKLLLRKKELLAHHHMISYLDKNRKWEMFFSGADLYGRSYLYRRNAFNKYCLKRMIRNDYSVLVLLLSIVSSILIYSILPFLMFLLILLPKTIRVKENYFSNYFYFICRDIIVLAGFVFFWPKKSKNIDYTIIN